MNKRQTERAVILARQSGKCILCDHGQHDIEGCVAPQLEAKSMCYVPEQDALICRTCNTFLAVYKNRAKVGVTPRVLELFLSRKRTE